MMGAENVLPSQLLHAVHFPLLHLHLDDMPYEELSFLSRMSLLTISRCLEEVFW